MMRGIYVVDVEDGSVIAAYTSIVANQPLLLGGNERLTEGRA